MSSTERTRCILYAGAPSSGRRTSLAALAGVEQVGSVVMLCWEAEPEPCTLELRLHSPTLDQGFVQRMDAVVFVVDPRRSRLGANDRALGDLRAQLSAAARPPKDVPVVFQLNKLDLPLDASGAQMFARFTGVDAPLPQLVRAPIATLKRRLAWPRCDFAETIASHGIGVREALERALALCRSSGSGYTARS